MEKIVTFELYIVIAAIVLVALSFFVWYLNRQKKAAQQRLVGKVFDLSGKKADVKRLPSPKPEGFRLGIALEEQNEELIEASLNLRKLWKKKKLSDGIVFVHGTFAGEDPFGVIGALPGNRFIAMRQVKKALAKVVKSNHDKFLKDNGNFLPEYVSLIDEILQPHIRSTRFQWSSENHHAGRLQAALSLASFLSKWKSHNLHLSNLMLIGHSHAGQVFALLSQLLYEKDLIQTLENDEKHQFEHQISRIDFQSLRELKIKIITYGMPVRYDFPVHKNMRLLHFINDRSNLFYQQGLAGILQTRTGDYIQRLGSEGSDFIALTSEDRAKNRYLDQVLKKGIDPKRLLERLSVDRSISPRGKTLLVDYGDYQKFKVNCLETLFGHGIYTKAEHLLFHMKTIAEEI